MSINRHPAIWAFLKPFMCIVWLSIVTPAYPAGKSPDDCKLENCQEWDEYLHDCVPIDPGPKPDGCYKLNDQCKWEPYTPDCKLLQDSVDSLIARIAWLAFVQLPAQRRQVAEASVQCDCEMGSEAACILAREYGPKPDNACEKYRQELLALDGWEYTLDLTEKEYEAAKKLLDDCLNCRNEDA